MERRLVNPLKEKCPVEGNSLTSKILVVSGFKSKYLIHTRLLAKIKNTIKKHKLKLKLYYANYKDILKNKVDITDIDIFFLHSIACKLNLNNIKSNAKIIHFQPAYSVNQPFEIFLVADKSAKEIYYQSEYTKPDIVIYSNKDKIIKQIEIKEKIFLDDCRHFSVTLEPYKVIITLFKALDILEVDYFHIQQKK